MIRPLALLLVSFAALWAVPAGVIYIGWGAVGLDAQVPVGDVLLVHSIATAICLAPMCITLIWTQLARRSGPDQQIVALFGGIGLRMFVVLGGGLILSRLLIPLRQNEMLFWLWVAVVYLATLAIEVVVMVRERNVPEVTLGETQKTIE